MIRLESSFSHRVFCVLVLWLVLLPSPAPAFDIWDGGGANDNWTTDANWFALFGPGTAPVNDGTADIRFIASGGLVQTPIVDVPYSINSLLFGDGDGRFVILGVAELTIAAGGITNNDADIQSVIGPVKLSANQTWTNNDGLLQMDAVNLNAFDLTVAGAFPIDLINVIYGTGNVHLPIGYSSTVTLLGGASNTYVGLTDVQGGTLRLQKTGGSQAVPGDLTIGNGATVLLAGNEQISQTAGNEVTVNAGGLLDVNTRTETLARLVLDGGDAVTSGAGKLVAAEALVTGNTATWTNSNNLYVGDSANGTLDVTAGGDVTCSVCFIGNQSGVTGDVDIDGMGSTLTTFSGLHVGYNGSGALSVTNGGQLTTAGTLTGSHIGSLPGSTGGVTVDGLGSVWNQINNSFLTIGSEGVGTLDITNHGQVNSSIGSSIGSLSTATGTVNVDDAAWTVSGNLFVGESGAGSLAILGGGQVTLDEFDRHSYIGWEIDSTGEVTVDGMGSTWTHTSEVGMQDVYVGYSGEGTLTITNGGQVSNRFGFVGYNPTAVGVVTVDGPGSTWNNTDNLFIGDQGDGTLHISNGATVSNYIAFVGNTGSGTVTVDGSGSTWENVNREVVVGNFGAGSVAITNGGRVHSSDGLVGAEDGSLGTVTVDGIGSVWDNDDDFSVDSGSLAITNGGRVTNMVGNIGTLAAGTGMVSVDGMGSAWVNASDLYVGIYNVGTLDVTSGGEVISVNGYVGFNPGSNGAVTVDGAGSRWTSTGDVSIGYFGEGVLTVSNGGTLEAANVYVGVNAPGELHGDGNIIGNVQNEGLVSPGTSPGPLNIDGNYTQTANGELFIELAAASFDQLIVTGDATLAGTLDVSVLSPFLIPGQAFEIIDVAGALAGTFAGLSEGGLVGNFSGTNLIITYAGGDGNDVTLLAALPGDFDFDLEVDGNDFLLWQRGESFTPFSATDLADWESYYGTVVPLPTSAATAVPEPTTGLALVIVATTLLFRRESRAN